MSFDRRLPCFQTPFGGPASGLWPSGRDIHPTLPAASAAPAPPTPTPACTVAGIFADCFVGDSGVVNPGSHGPRNGWTWSDTFGPKGGQVSFSSGIMALQMLANNNVPGATSPTKISIPTINNKTFRLTFKEFAAATGAGNSFYDFYVAGAGLVEGLELKLKDDGTLFVVVGPTGIAEFYDGVWTPNNGTHVIHLTIDNAGVPTLLVDGVPVVLSDDGPSGISFGTIPANSVAAFMSTGIVFPDQGNVTKLFVASGQLPASTVFCCP